jgi:hypothetical protein
MNMKRARAQFERIARCEEACSGKKIISVFECQCCIVAITGVKISIQRILLMAQKFENFSGKIIYFLTYEDYVRVVESVLCTPDEHLDSLYSLLDRNRKGWISKKDLNSVRWPIYSS